jgi:predicted phosphate transport protein (TIGR00153 family)
LVGRVRGASGAEARRAREYNGAGAFDARAFEDGGSPMFFLDNDKGFYELFDQMGLNVVHAAELFLDMMRNFELRKDFAAKIHEAERKGDSLTHDAITKLDKSFLTPFDRDDIHALVKQADDVVDRLDGAAKRMMLYGIDKPNEDMLKQAEMALQTARCLGRALQKLRELKNQTELSALLIEIHDWENRGDEHVQGALARLFETGDPMYVLKWKELYELVEKSIDACDTVANTIRSIMVKNA